MRAFSEGKHKWKIFEYMSTHLLEVSEKVLMSVTKYDTKKEYSLRFVLFVVPVQ